LNYTFRDVTLTESEFNDLKWTVGEYRRICREQLNGDKDSFSFQRFQNAENIISFLNEVEVKNKIVK